MATNFDSKLESLTLTLTTTLTIVEDITLCGDPAFSIPSSLLGASLKLP